MIAVRCFARSCEHFDHRRFIFLRNPHGTEPLGFRTLGRKRASLAGSISSACRFKLLVVNEGHAARRRARSGELTASHQSEVVKVVAVRCFARSCEHFDQPEIIFFAKSSRHGTAWISHRGPEASFARWIDFWCSQIQTAGS